MRTMQAVFEEESIVATLAELFSYEELEQIAEGAVAFDAAIEYLREFDQEKYRQSRELRDTIKGHSAETKQALATGDARKSKHKTMRKMARKAMRYDAAAARAGGGADVHTGKKGKVGCPPGQIMVFGKCQQRSKEGEARRQNIQAMRRRYPERD